MSAHQSGELIRQLLEAQDRMLEAIADYQAKADAVVDCGQRIRAAAERLRTFGGNLDDVGVMRLPRGIVPVPRKPEPPEAA